MSSDLIMGGKHKLFHSWNRGVYGSPRLKDDRVIFSSDTMENMISGPIFQVAITREEWHKLGRPSVVTANIEAGDHVNEAPRLLPVSLSECGTYVLEAEDSFGVDLSFDPNGRYVIFLQRGERFSALSQPALEAIRAEIDLVLNERKQVCDHTE